MTERSWHLPTVVQALPTSLMKSETCCFSTSTNGTWYLAVMICVPRVRKLAAQLFARYLVIGELAGYLCTPIFYVSLAGTMSSIMQMIAPWLKVSGYFKFVFQNGYHLSLTEYATLKCFKGSYLKQVHQKVLICLSFVQDSNLFTYFCVLQVINVTQCIIDLLEGLDKSALLLGLSIEIFMNSVMSNLPRLCWRHRFSKRWAGTSTHANACMESY